MNWREAFRLAASNFRQREKNSRNSPFGTEQERAEKAHAYAVCAQELEYAAQLHAHEGAAYVRKLGGQAT